MIRFRTGIARLASCPVLRSVPLVPEMLFCVHQFTSI
jgi:hypothetical protein